MRLSAPSPPSFRVSQSKKSKLESKSKSEVRPIRPTHKNLPNSSNSVQPCYDRNSDGWQKCFTNVPPGLGASQPITMSKMFVAASAATASSATLPPRGSVPTENAIMVRTKSRRKNIHTLWLGANSSPDPSQAPCRAPVGPSATKLSRYISKTSSLHGQR